MVSQIVGVVAIGMLSGFGIGYGAIGFAVTVAKIWGRT